MEKSSQPENTQESKQEKRPFEELTTEQAEETVAEIIRTSKSVGEIRSRLSECGFDGDAAAIASLGEGGHFMAMVMAYGPHGEIITGKPKA